MHDVPSVRREVSTDAITAGRMPRGAQANTPGCTARSRKANLKSCGPAETKVVVKQRDDRPLRVEFGWFVPAGDEVPSVPPMLLFNADAALVQGPGLQVIEPSSFGVLVIDWHPLYRDGSWAGRTMGQSRRRHCTAVGDGLGRSGAAPVYIRGKRRSAAVKCDDGETGSRPSARELVCVVGRHWASF